MTQPIERSSIRAFVAALGFLLLSFSFVTEALYLVPFASANNQTAHPEIEIENPRPPSLQKSRHKAPTDEDTIQLRYRIVPGTSGVSSARLEVWDRPDLLTKIPVRVSKSGEVAWTDNSVRSPSRLEFAITSPDSSKFCDTDCDNGRTLSEAAWVTVAGDVPPSFLSDPVVVRAGTETMSLELDGRFFAPSTKVLLEEPTSKKDIWKAWEFLAVEFVDANQIRVAIPWTYLASPHTLVLQPFNLDEVERAQNNGLPLNGVEQKLPAGGGSQTIIYVASPTSPTLTNIEPAELAANASDKTDSVVILHGRGFTRASSVVLGRDPLQGTALAKWSKAIMPKYVSSEALELRVPASELRFSGVAYSKPGPIHVWVRNGDSSLQISESRDIQILATAKLPAAPPSAVIMAISPTPLKLMPPEGSALEEVTVIGKNFRSSDLISARADEGAELKLQTQFVSSTELRASVPRQIWREHRISYRFVIVTPQGERATELYEDGEVADAEASATR